MNLVKPIHGLKNVKNHPKTLNQPETKRFFELRYVFIGVFKVKIPNLNSPHHMKPFDIKIDCFGGLNLPQQQQLSLSKPESNDLFSLFHEKKQKKRKMKFGIKIYIFKITETDHVIVKKDEG
jgi:hypothetical protein